MRRTLLVVLLPCVLFAAANVEIEAPDTQTHQGSASAATAPLNATVIAYHTGECAVGLTCGAAAAWIVRKVQSTFVTLSVLSSIGTVAALHLQWISLDQVKAAGLILIRVLQQKLVVLRGQFDLDKDGELTLEDSRLAYSRVVPLVRRHTALSGGFVGGFVGAMGALR